MRTQNGRRGYCVKYIPTGSAVGMYLAPYPYLPFCVLFYVRRYRTVFRRTYYCMGACPIRMPEGEVVRGGGGSPQGAACPTPDWLVVGEGGVRSIVQSLQTLRYKGAHRTGTYCHNVCFLHTKKSQGACKESRICPSSKEIGMHDFLYIDLMHERTISVHGIFDIHIGTGTVLCTNNVRYLLMLITFLAKNYCIRKILHIYLGR